MSHQIFIDICSNCKQHAWCTRHNETTYLSLAEQLKKSILSNLSNAIVKINLVGDTRLGSFQVVCNNITLFSKLELGYFPHTALLTNRIVAFLDDVKKGNDLQKYKYSNSPIKHHPSFKKENSKSPQKNLPSNLVLLGNQSDKKQHQQPEQSGSKKEVKEELKKPEKSQKITEVKKEEKKEQKRKEQKAQRHQKHQKVTEQKQAKKVQVKGEDKLVHKIVQAKSQKKSQVKSPEVKKNEQVKAHDKKQAEPKNTQNQKPQQNTMQPNETNEHKQLKTIENKQQINIPQNHPQKTPEKNVQVHQPKNDAPNKSEPKEQSKPLQTPKKNEAKEQPKPIQAPIAETKENHQQIQAPNKIEVREQPKSTQKQVPQAQIATKPNTDIPVNAASQKQTSKQKSEVKAEIPAITPVDVKEQENGPQTIKKQEVKENNPVNTITIAPTNSQKINQVPAQEQNKEAINRPTEEHGEAHITNENKESPIKESIASPSPQQ